MIALSELRGVYWAFDVSFALYAIAPITAVCETHIFLLLNLTQICNCRNKQRKEKDLEKDSLPKDVLDIFAKVERGEVGGVSYSEIIGPGDPVNTFIHYFGIIIDTFHGDNV